jgi:hypothetical protein
VVIEEELGQARRWWSGEGLGAGEEVVVWGGAGAGKESALLGSRSPLAEQPR